MWWVWPGSIKSKIVRALAGDPHNYIWLNFYMSWSFYNFLMLNGSIKGKDRNNVMLRSLLATCILFRNRIIGSYDDSQCIRLELRLSVSYHSLFSCLLIHLEFIIASWSMLLSVFLLISDLLLTHIYILIQFVIEQ